MHEPEPAAAAAEGEPAREARGRRDRRNLPPIHFLQERGLALLRAYLQDRENAAHGRDYAVYDQRWNRALGQRIGRHRRNTNGLLRNGLDDYFRPLFDPERVAEWNVALDTYDQTEAARQTRRLNLLRRNGARLLRAHLDILIKNDDVGRDYEEHEGRVVGTYLEQLTYRGPSLVGTTPECSQALSGDCGSSCSTGMTKDWMQTALPALPAQMSKVDEEFQNFWGPLQAATATSFSSRSAAPAVAMSQSSQENHVFQDELMEFWHGHVLLKHGVFSGSYQDFHAAITPPTFREPVPVPIPAAQNAEFSSTVDDFLCRGEGWQPPQAAGSSVGAPGGLYRAKHVDRGRCNLQAAKRAYKRACRRAEKSIAGGTWYRGRWMTSSDLDSRYVSSARSRHFSQAVAQHSFGGKKIEHLSLLSWNAGGLATHTWDGSQNWLATQQIQICCIQETWWPLQTDWSNGCYHILHHGTGRSGGLMTMIHSKLASKECIRSGSLANGRV